MNIGKALEILRRDMDYTQDYVAEELGVKSNYISLLERGDREPSLPLLQRAARLFNVSILHLFIIALDADDIEKEKESLIDCSFLLQARLMGFASYAYARKDAEGNVNVCKGSY